jgi:hypothetical protein
MSAVDLSWLCGFVHGAWAADRRVWPETLDISEEEFDALIALGMPEGEWVPFCPVCGAPVPKG